MSAAYGLLADANSRDLSIDALARAAGVTRATLYNQFGSRAGLMIAIFRDLGQRMKAERIQAAMRLPEPAQALSALLRESTRAYARERQAIRKLLALAVLDREVQAEVEHSERQRRQSLLALAKRLLASAEARSELAEATELLASLTSFQAFEALSFDVGPRVAERRLLDLARAGLGMSKAGKGGAE